jgi:hypothetical protein
MGRGAAIQVTAILAAALAASGTSSLAGEVSLAEYAERLLLVAGRLDSGEHEAARSAARDLLEAEVLHGDTTLAPDASVLRPAAEAGTAAEARRAARAAGALAREIERRLSEIAAGPPSPAAAPDAALVEAIRIRQTPRAAEAGGEVGLPGSAPAGFLETAGEAIEGIADWVGGKLRALWRWIVKLWPRGGPERADGSPALPAIVTLLVAAATGLVAFLAARSLRGAKGLGGLPAPARSAAALSEADADPLSRGAGEWERYARQLAASGRPREAVRAWYHAVLIGLSAAGLLHYRRGRTNWEYVAALPPEAGFRSGFAEVTRVFERVWYGRAEPDEALPACEEGARRLLLAVRAGSAEA